MTGLYTLQAHVKLGRCCLIPFRILYAAALTSSKPTKMGSSDSSVAGFHKSANLFTNPEPTRTKLKVKRSPFALYLSWCCFELYYDTVWGTISFPWWLYRSCVGNWVKIFPAITVPQCSSTKQRSSCTDNFKIHVATLRSDNGDVHENHAEKSDRLRILSNHFAIIPSRPVT